MSWNIGRVNGASSGRNAPTPYVFETPVPEGTTRMRKYPSAPHPFVFLPPLEEKTRYRAGETLTFDMTLTGKGAAYLPYFIYSVRASGTTPRVRQRARPVQRSSGPVADAVRGDPCPFLPFLRLEEVLHIGKHSSFGMGSAKTSSSSTPGKRRCCSHTGRNWWDREPKTLDPVLDV